MSGRRVAVVGRVPDRARRHTGFPELRTDATVQALRAAGHEVRLVGLCAPGEQGGEGASESTPAGTWAGEVRVIEEGPGWLQAVQEACLEARVLVGAGPHNGSRAACLVAGERPVWGDVPGDPFAELQAVAQATGQAQAERQAAAAAALLPVLARADRFGAVSEGQRLLLQGQLGLVGRLAAPGSAGLVDVVPVSWHFDLPARAPTPRAARAPLRIALIGGLNAWLDVGLLLEGLGLALSRCDGIDLVVAGGPVPGHHMQGWEQLKAWAEGRLRVQLRPRLPPKQLATLMASAHATVFVDRQGLEPETGSRTRALFALHQGLEVVATTSTEVCAMLADRQLIVPLVGADSGQPTAQDIAAALVGLHAQPTGHRPAQAQAQLPSELGAEASMAPVCRFVDAPQRGPILAHPLADLARSHAELRDELARVHASPTWRVLSRLHRATGGGD